MSLPAKRESGAVASWHVPSTHEGALALADMIARSGLAPSGLNTAQQVAVAMAYGNELGMLPMQALRSIHVIKGKPTLSADAMLALVQASDACEWWVFDELSTERVTASTLRRGAPKPTSLTWTLADAERAGLMKSNDNWKKYPRAMLRARCVSELVRSVYPDVISGYYTPEELGANVDADGDVIDVRAEVVTEVPAALETRAAAANTEPTPPPPPPPKGRVQATKQALERLAQRHATICEIHQGHDAGEIKAWLWEEAQSQRDQRVASASAMGVDVVATVEVEDADAAAEAVICDLEAEGRQAHNDETIAGGVQILLHAHPGLTEEQARLCMVEAVGDVDGTPYDPTGHYDSAWSAIGERAHVLAAERVAKRSRRARATA